ncbi:MAG: hypothetical protein AB7O49_10495 [Sphingomonadales bacterium]
MKRLAYGLMVGTLASMALTFPASARDRDDNPPGPAGGPGTNWENPPGPRGGPGTSPDRVRRVHGHDVHFVVHDNGYYYNDRYGYYYPGRGYWVQSKKCWWDRDDNPPGPAGGPGTNWENPPGPRGGPGMSPDRYGSCK